MLLELRIKNFAIIDKLSLSFGPALNIFTGETGAGKSIVIDAISLILGDRASGDLIRADTEEAEVEALFDITGAPGTASVLEAAGIEAAEELVIKRVVQRTGRNRIYINGSLATLVTLGEVGRSLIDVYGQSEHQSLTRPEEHIELLDAFAGLKGPGKLREEMGTAYSELRERRAEYDSLVKGAGELERRAELLRYASDEIADAELASGEEVELKAEKERLGNAGKIKSAVVEAQSGLYDDSGAIVERLGALLAPLKEAAGFDPRLKSSAESVEEALYGLEDAANTLRDLADSIGEEPERLDEILDRIDLIGKLIKKYGPDIDAVLAHKATVDAELASLGESEAETASAEAALKEAGERASGIATELSKARSKGAGQLKSLVETELGDLGMEAALFDIKIEAVVDKENAKESAPGNESALRIGEKGYDRVYFLLAPNAGEEAKPLARIASGGELSRIMLALKRATVSATVATLVFDEVDAGIGGATAQTVGFKLKEVGERQQVICITHLPQIAAFAGKHFGVSKRETEEGRTVSSVVELDRAEKVEQISQMLGGQNVTETTRKHAAELIEAARR
ncbi:MAG: DNA repair protein RecN [Proteobacteria bacterium]|nr:DNA repair protein RecN [Pseudomonadota bacterium]